MSVATQRPRSWGARITWGTALGALVALLAVLGYDATPPNAGASFQPEPTSIAFVPLHPTPAPPAAARASLAPAVRAGAAFAALDAPEAVDAVEVDAAAVLAARDACAFPCVPQGAPVDEEADVATEDEDTADESTDGSESIDGEEATDGSDSASEADERTGEPEPGQGEDFSGADSAEDTNGSTTVREADAGD